MSDLCNKTLYDFLSEVKTKAHHIYALMQGLPRSNFYLFRYYDYANRIDGGLKNEKGTVFTLQEYIDDQDLFHPKDSFGIYFDAELESKDQENDYTAIDTTEEANIPSLRKHINIFLKAYCEQQLRRNTPFELNSGTIARYGFTPADLRELRRSVTRYTRMAKERIRAEYDELNNLDFIHTGE